MAAQAQDRLIGDEAILLNAVTATGAGPSLAMAGYHDLTVVCDHVGSATATVTFQGTVDGGTTWFSLGLVSLADHSTTAATDASSGSAKTAAYALPANRRIPLTHFRANLTSRSAGTITVKARRATVYC